MKGIMKKLANLSMKKKLTGLAIGVVGFVCALSYGMAEGTTKLIITPDKENAAHGDTIVYTLKLENDQEYNGINFTMEFDPDELEYVSSSMAYNDDGVDYDLRNKEEGLKLEGKIIWTFAFASSYQNNDATLGTITFKVKDKASGNVNVLIKDQDISRSDIDDLSATPTPIPTEVEESPKPVFVAVPVNQDSIQLKANTLAIDFGTDNKSANIEINYLPLNTTDSKNFTYQITSGADVIDLDTTTGVVTAKKTGTATVKVTAFGKEMTATINVEAPLKGISLNQQDLEVDFNNLSAVKLNVIANPTTTTDTYTVAWKSSNDDVVSVDNSGNLTFHKKGSAIITATASVTGTDRSYSANATVVVKAAATAISITEGNIELNKQGTTTLHAVTTPTEVDDTVVWSVDDSEIATVDQQGNVRALKGGTTTITATAGRVHDTITVKVNVPVEKIELDMNELQLLPTQTRTLVATVSPEDATYEKITWSSTDTGVATVDQTGKITAIAPGTTTIKAEIGSIKAECQVKVLIPITDFIIDTPSATLDLSKDNQKMVTLAVRILPENTEESKTITWTTADRNIATVNTNGVVTAVGKGDVVITGTLPNGKTVTSNIKVIASVKAIELDQKEVKLVGKNVTKKLNVVFTPTDPTNKKVTWQSSDTGVATVDASGVVTSVGKGTANITATSEDGGHIATSKVTVTVPATSVSIRGNKKIKLELGNTTSLSAIVEPSDTSDDLIWSTSKPGVATVTPTGEIATVGTGTTIITAQAGDKKDTVEIEVYIKVQSFDLVTDANVDILRHSQSIVKTEILPANATEDKTITWTSDDEDVAIVDENGIITGVGEGTATITGVLENTEDQLTVSVDVTVTIIPLTKIEVKKAEFEMLRKEKYVVELDFEPITTTELDQVIWTSDDEEIATVENGIVTGHKAGTTIIRAEYDGLETFAEVTVNEIPLESISIVNTANTLEIGKTLELNIALNPLDTTDDIELLYESSDNSIASVDENGIITAHKAGTVTITVTANGKFNTTFEMTIVEPKNPNTGDSLTSSIMGLIGGIILGGALFISKKFKLLKR